MEAANITGMRYSKKSYMHTVVCVCVYMCVKRPTKNFIKQANRQF